MKRYLAVFTGSQQSWERSGWDKLSEEEQQERSLAGFEAWAAWGDKHKAAIVDGGAPLGRTKRIGRDGVADVKNLMTGYAIVKADSHEAAAALFEGHPHYTIFPGEGVEIMECLPIPTA